MTGFRVWLEDTEGLIVGAGSKEEHTETDFSAAVERLRAWVLQNPTRVGHLKVEGRDQVLDVAHWHGDMLVQHVSDEFRPALLEHRKQSPGSPGAGRIVLRDEVEGQQ